MKIDRIENRRPNSPDATVTVKTTGNIVEIRYISATVHGIPVQKLDKDHGVDLRTGEVIEYKHSTNRSEDKASVAQSLKKLRDLINANLTDPATALWVTLTYRENMTDTTRLYEDFRRFWQRFRYYLKKHDFPIAEYIAAAEPQGRGAWHLHCLFLFPDKAPFIPNDDLARIWKHGFTKTKSLKGVDNPGLYLTAYLGDMEYAAAIDAKGNGEIAADKSTGRIVEIETADEHGQRKKKAIIKGARLHLYPPGFNLYRHSLHIKHPTIQETTEAEAQRIVGSAPLTFEKTIALTEESGNIVNTINYRQYNEGRRKNEDE